MKRREEPRISALNPWMSGDQNCIGIAYLEDTLSKLVLRNTNQAQKGVKMIWNTVTIHWYIICKG